MDSEFEDQSRKCSSLKDLRNAATRYPDFQSTALDSVSHVKLLLLKLFERLELKENKFQGFCPASSSEIDKLWAQLQDIDSTILPNDSMTKAAIEKKTDLKRLIQHSCVQRHYFFVIKKCGSTACTINFANPRDFYRRCLALSTVFQIQYLVRTVITNPLIMFWAPKQTILTAHLFKRRHTETEDPSFHSKHPACQEH